MTDEEIEKVLASCGDLSTFVCDECPLYGDPLCFSTIRVKALEYINRLKAEIAGLTGKADALESDRDNLLRTLGEANEELVFLKAEIERIRHNWEISKAVQRTRNRKETAKEILQDIIAKSSDDFGSREIATSDLIIIFKKYGVEVDE